MTLQAQVCDGRDCEHPPCLTFRRLRAIYRYVRATGDAQPQGRDWGRQALGIQENREVQDLGTEARLTWISCQMALLLLSRSEDTRERTMSRLAIARLHGAGTRALGEKLGLGHNETAGLLQEAREYLHDMVSVRTLTDVVD